MSTSTTKYAERSLARIMKLDGEISAIKDKLDAKLNERRLLLTGLITEGESTRTSVSNEVRALVQANALATTGRTLTDDQVREIRRLHKAGVSQCQLGRQFGLAQPTIHKIVHRRSYVDVA